MKQFSLVGLCVAVLAVAFAQGADEKPKFDATKLEGKWSIVTGEKNGEKITGESIKGEITFTKDKITIKGGDEMHEMSYTVDAKGKIVAIDMEGLKGPAKGFKALGIIELNGDALKLCYAMPDAKRPTEFAAKKDGMTLYFTLKRAK